MKTARHDQAFTVIELLIGLLITSILMAAVATLAFAMSTGARDAEDTIRAEAELRYATLRLGELFRTGRLLCAAPDTDLVVWAVDDRRPDVIDANEVVYLEYDDPNHALKLRQFVVKNSPTVVSAVGLPGQPVLAVLALASTKTALVQAYTPTNRVRRTTLLPGCSNVTFMLDQSPPRTRRVTISFDRAEGQGLRHYEIAATLCASTEHLLSSDETNLIADDD
ncbi:MAG: prepilin-type N-terminal cleavage/methylation domain-containing protein [Planctomycetes bacterium]|nr:prepilin-type N-terminal cleavage/methylation domain-containing protein [Planctomycetota bacterium]